MMRWRWRQVPSQRTAPRPQALQPVTTTQRRPVGHHRCGEPRAPASALTWKPRRKAEPLPWCASAEARDEADRHRPPPVRYLQALSPGDLPHEASPHQHQPPPSSSPAGAALAAVPALFNMSPARQAHDDQDRISRCHFTGAFSAEAQDQVRAAELAVKEWNAAGGHKGQMAELLVRDDKLNPGEAATRTLELIEKDKVNFIVGSLSSAATQLSINAVTRERKVLFNSISQSDTINEAKDWSLYTFHEALNPHLTAGAVARYVFPKFGQEDRLPHGRLRLRPRDGARLPARGPGLRHADAGRHPPSAGCGRLLGLPAAHPGAEARRAGAVQLRPRPGQQPPSRRPTSASRARHQDHRAGAAVHRHARPAGPRPSKASSAAPRTTGAWKTRFPSAKKFNDAFRKAYGGAVPSDYGALGYAGIRSVLQAVKDADATDSVRVSPSRCAS